MKRINSGRQTISAKQRNCNYRPSGCIAPHVIAGTIIDPTFPAEQQVSCRIASAAFQVGCLTISRRQVYYLVATKFEGRYYVVVRENGEWKCSEEHNERLLAHLMMKVSAYRMVIQVNDFTCPRHEPDEVIDEVMFAPSTLDRQIEEGYNRIARTLQRLEELL